MGMYDSDYENSFDSGEMNRALDMQFNNRDPNMPKWYDKDPEAAYWVLPDGTRMTDSQYNAWLAKQDLSKREESDYEQGREERAKEEPRTRETKSGRVYISPTTGEVRTQKEADKDLGFFEGLGKGMGAYQFNPDTGEYEFDYSAPGTMPRMLNILGDLGMLYMLSQGNRPGERKPKEMKDDADPAFQENTNWNPQQQQQYDYWSNIAPSPRRNITLMDPSSSISPSVGYARGGLASVSRPQGPTVRNQGALRFMDGGSNHVSGDTGGQDDLIDAALSDGEYVLDADIVSALGDGNNARGAKVLDAMREEIRRHKRGAPANKIPPKAKSPLEYVSAARGDKKGA